jgi:hypothetical protein
LRHAQSEVLAGVRPPELRVGGVLNGTPSIAFQ